MKKLFVLLTALVASATFSVAANGWGDNYAKALTSAKADKKLVLLDFTGSDWCSWCQKLDKEVFSKADFKDFAKENLELVTVDFPEKKLSSKLEKQNAELKKKYSPNGFPTLVLVDGDGKEVHRIGGYKADALDDLKKAVEANKPK
jgi:protein disulfide-isomerase